MKIQEASSNAVRKCCCWGTPIGDTLLQIAENLNPGGNTLLAQLDTAPEIMNEDMPEKETVNSKSHPNLYKLVQENIKK